MSPDADTNIAALDDQLRSKRGNLLKDIAAKRTADENRSSTSQLCEINLFEYRLQSPSRVPYRIGTPALHLTR
jgi:hypothetical protein